MIKWLFPPNTAIGAQMQPTSCESNQKEDKEGWVFFIRKKYLCACYIIWVAPHYLSTKQMHVNYNALLAVFESFKVALFLKIGAAK